MRKPCITTLTYAIRLRVVVHYLGQIAIMLAIVTLVPLGASLLIGEYDYSLRFLAILVLLVAIRLALFRLSAPAQIQVNEALTITALAFLLTPLLMTYPLMLADLPLLDAFFESVSAITTTGLTTLPTVEDKPKSFLFARAWIQWYGGLGIVVLSVALLMGHQMAARRLTEPVSGQGLATTARTYARRMLGVYLVLTTLGFLIVWLLVDDAFTALVHVLTAVSTAGFSVFDDSLAQFIHGPTAFAIIGIAFLGAIPFPLYYRLYHGGLRVALTDIELRALVLAAITIVALLASFMHLNSGLAWSETAAHALLLGVSAQTSTGFSSMDVGELDDASKLTLILAMSIGGGSGSTAGGIKILRLIILLRLVQLTILRTAIPNHAVLEPRLGGKPLAQDDMVKALLLLALFSGVVLVSWLTFLAFGYPAMDALFEVVSATGTVGLSTGIANSDLHPLLKATLCADMLLGRLEVIALVLLFYPRTWFGKRSESQ